MTSISLLNSQQSACRRRHTLYVHTHAYTVMCSRPASCYYNMTSPTRREGVWSTSAYIPVAFWAIGKWWLINNIHTMSSILTGNGVQRAQSHYPYVWTVCCTMSACVHGVCRSAGRISPLLFTGSFCMEFCVLNLFWQHIFQQRTGRVLETTMKVKAQ